MEERKEEERKRKEGNKQREKERKRQKEKESTHMQDFCRDKYSTKWHRHMQP
jgi:hypothetical protein